ncbi:MAG: HTH-type transcriptional repressor YtrA [Spirochaetes bacterium ADurb.Bin315]|nr:GntR family transcriptional regulator [Spirochaetales bacterium]OQA43136.1 MAG: HTH-type transcriptional repressor YtrA [Spirochaetes bacterium ADurb.Bin315]HOR80419.1 GntR family transcriptional regulator [Sphaerochaeta sp.]
MNIQISNASNDPIYVQIKNQIKSAIISGSMAAGEQLPSIRYLAKELRVSVITTKRAYDELEAEGFINSVQGRGSYVSLQNEEFIREEQLRKVEASLLEAIKGAKLAGLSMKDLKEILDTLEGVEDDA